MISKLKRKFTILATISMIVLMSVLLLIMNIVNFTSVVNESDSVLGVISIPDINFSDDKTPPEKPDSDAKDFVPRGMSPEVPYESRYFSVTIDDNGKIINSDLTRIISVDGDSVNDYIEKVVNKKSQRGFVGQFRYLKQTEANGTRIIFLDCGRKIDAFYTFLWTSIGVGFFGCIIVFVTFLFVSGKIVKPISEAYEKQKRFISDAGHEIKTPLTIINANVDLLSCDTENEELNEIRNQTKRLTRLTNNLVYLSKMEESDHIIRKIDMPISDIVFETVNSFNALAASKNISILQNITPNLSMNGSPDAVRQLVSILLENAVKYSGDNGTITVDLTLNKKYVVLSVSNETNEAISKDSISHVFDRFYRNDTSRNSSTGGHGIGLSIAKAVVEGHKGNITATTKTGNDFVITAELPI